MICLPNSIAFASTLLGTLAAGLTATLVSPALKPDELSPLIRISRPAVIIVGSSGLQTILDAIHLAGSVLRKETLNIFIVEQRAQTVDLIHHSTDNTLQIADWTRLTKPDPSHQSSSVIGSEGFSFSQPAPEARHRIALILWSSGTSTGKPKGIKLSHRALVSALVSLWRISPQYVKPQRFVGFAPFYHVFGLSFTSSSHTSHLTDPSFLISNVSGLVNVLLISITIRATVFVMPQFKLEKLLQMVASERITCLHIAPPVAAMLAHSDLVDRYDLSSLCGAVSGGAPLAGDLIQAVYKRTGVLITIVSKPSSLGS